MHAFHRGVELGVGECRRWPRPVVGPDECRLGSERRKLGPDGQVPVHHTGWSGS
jgi:hypothetical protein